MNYQHKYLAAGRWKELLFLEQMANIGSEVERALNWKTKHNAVYSQNAFERALELVDLTLDTATGFPRLKELARLREAIVDYFIGVNQFKSTEVLWKRYFLPFTYAARSNSEPKASAIPRQGGVWTGKVMTNPPQAGNEHWRQLKNAKRKSKKRKTKV